MAGKARALETLGQRLRHWRRHRELTQLAVANETGISQRHISFLENGRSRVGSSTLQRLIDCLDLQDEDAGELYALAGLAWPRDEFEHGSSETEGHTTDPREAMSAAQLEAMHRLFRAHDPLPAIAVDRRWDVVAVNRGARILGPLAAPDVNLIEAFFEPEAREYLADWSTTARGLLARLRLDTRVAADDRGLAGLYERFAGRVPECGEADPRGILVQLRTPYGRVAFISLGASFTEVSLRPALRFELLYPADDQSERRLSQWNLSH